jgi:branched-chain amino acid transport system substrate-binding protein
LAKNGEYITNAVNMALEVVNASGGIKGRKLEAVFLDDQVKSSEAINAVKKAIDDLKVPVILGSDSSGLVLASMPFAAKAGVPQVVSATNVRITNQGVPSIFRMRADDAVAAKILAEYVLSKGFKKIGIMYTNEDYGKGFMEEIQKNLTAKANPASALETCNIGDTDFTAQILSFKNKGVDTVMALGKEIETAKFLRQSKELGLNVQMFGGSPLGLDYVVDLAGGAMEGVKIVTHFLPSDPDPKIQAWVTKYKNLYKGQEPETHVACYYDAVKMVADIMNKNGVTKEAITKGLKEVNYVGIQSAYKGSATGDLVTKQVVGDFKKGVWVVTDSLGK